MITQMLTDIDVDGDTWTHRTHLWYMCSLNCQNLMEYATLIIT